MTSEYDALLDPPSSDYDALLTPPSEYDALLDVPSGISPAVGNLRAAEPAIEKDARLAREVANIQKNERIVGADPFEEIASGTSPGFNPDAGLGEPFVVLPKPGGSGVGAGIVRGAANLVEGLTTPEMVAAGALLPGAPALVQKAAALGFGASMATHLPEQTQAVIDAQTPGQMAEKATELAGSVALTGLALKHGASARPVGPSAIAERRAAGPTPATDLALKETTKGGEPVRENERQTQEVQQTEITPVETTAAPEIAPAGKAAAEEPAPPSAIAGPALRNAGEEPLRGAIGDEHGQMKIAAAKRGEDFTDAEHGFHDQAGNFLSRTEAAQRALDTGLVDQSEFEKIMARDEPGLTSQDLKRLTEAKATATPTVEDTVSDAVREHGDLAGAGEHLQGRLDALEADPGASVEEKTLVRKALKRIGNLAENQSREEAAAEATQGREGQYELLSSVRELGGLPTIDSPHGKEMSGELQRIVETFPTGRQGAHDRNQLFRPDAKALDDLRQSLEERGFRFETPDEMLSAIEAARTTGREHFAEGALPFGPGKMTEGELPPQKTTGLKRAVVDTERLQRGAEPIPTVERQHEEAVVQEAENAVDSDPTKAPALVERINSGSNRAITEQEAAILLVERQRLKNMKEAAEDKAGDPDTTPEERTVARDQWQAAEDQMEALDRAQRSAGSTWGRLGHMYQRLIQEDFTLAAMERRERAARGRPLTPEESAKIAAQAKEIEALQAKVDEGQKAQEAARVATARTQVLESTIADMQKEASTRPKFSKDVFDIAQGIVDRWKTEADSARQSLRQRLGKTSAGLDPTVLVDVAKIIRAKVGELGLDFARTSAAMIAEFGNDIQPYLQRGWLKAQQMIDKEKAAPKVKQAIKKGTAKPKAEKAPVDVAARAKAEAAAGMDLRGETAYQAVRAAIAGGAKGEAPIMEAAVEILKPSYPDLTLRKLDEAFTDYGKAKHPSQEAINVQLRKQRQLRQMILKIQDLEKTGRAPRFGMIRDKPDADVRARIKELQAAVDKFSADVPDTPEMIANQEAIAIRTKENAIERLDRQLRGVEAEIKKAPREQSAKVQTLQAELDAMRALKKEIDDAANPPKSPEERYNETRLKAVNKQIAALEDRLKRRDFAKREKKPTPPKGGPLISAEAELNRVRQKVRKGEHDLWLKNRPLPRKILGGFRQTLDASKNLTTAFDFSAPRQGFVAAVTHPIKGAKALPAMFKAWASETKAREMQAALDHRPNAQNGFYDQADIEFTKLDETNFSAREENLRSVLDDWAEHGFKTGNLAKTIATAVPKAVAKGVRMSNRAFITFLNQLRADTFDALVDANYRGRQPPTANELAVLGNYVNIATGRGRVNPKLASAAGIVLWSPKLLASRFQYILGQPLWHGLAHGKVEASGRARYAVAKEYAKFLVGAYALYNVSKLFGTVEDDPRSSDFGKIRIGKTRLDIWGGLQQASVLLSKETSGKSKGTKSGKVVPIRFPEGVKKPFGADSGGDVAMRFLRTKFSPAFGTTFDLLSGENIVGEKVTSKTVASNLVVPLTFRDVFSVMRENGVPKAVALEILSQFGAGLSVYDEQSKERPR